jgi:HPr kinase/phosphorylase
MTRNLQPSRHGCALVLGRTGLIVLGPSGSGKSHLCTRLIERWNADQSYARWVADDRIVLTPAGSSIIAHAPAQLQGLAERRHFGIEVISNLSRAIIDIAVQILPRGSLERMPDDQWFLLSQQGPRVPLLSVPDQDTAVAIGLISATLALKPLSGGLSE